jgi:hypothetical protein
MGDGKKNKGRPPKLPTVDPIDEVEAERLFLESLENMDTQAILREKRKGADEPETVSRPRPSRGDGQVDFTQIFTKLGHYGYDGWAVLEWECAFKHPEQGAAEGAPFIARQMIRKPERAFDDFAGSGADLGAVRAALGLNK